MQVTVAEYVQPGSKPGIGLPGPVLPTMDCGVGDVLHTTLDFVVYRFLKTARRALGSFLSRAGVTRIFNLFRGLVRFQRVFGPTSALARQEVCAELPCIDAEARPFSAMLDHLLHELETCPSS